jgi:hypothetical protein
MQGKSTSNKRQGKSVKQSHKEDKNGVPILVDRMTFHSPGDVRLNTFFCCSGDIVP